MRLLALSELELAASTDAPAADWSCWKQPSVVETCWQQCQARMPAHQPQTGILFPVMSGCFTSSYQVQHINLLLNLCKHSSWQSSPWNCLTASCSHSLCRHRRGTVLVLPALFHTAVHQECPLFFIVASKTAAKDGMYLHILSSNA